MRSSPHVRSAVLLAVTCTVIAGSVLVAAPASTPAWPGALCARPVNVPGQGPSCRTPNGLWQIHFADGMNALTHGPDVIPFRGYEEFGRVTPRKPSCVTNGATQFHTEVIYARPRDVPNNYSNMLFGLRYMIYQANGMLWRESGGFGVHMLYRMLCSGGEASIRQLTLSIPKAQVNYSNVVSAVRQAGYTNPVAKYWIWVDAKIPNAANVGGQAIITPDDRLAADNGNNYGPGYGVFYGALGSYGAEVIMHEGSHSMGAVQDSAPDSTWAGHCIDDADVMCYNDGGPRGPLFKSNVCRTIHYDCNYNDYFNPKPSRRNYLATHWNLGSPLNRFFAGCGYYTGVLTLGTAGQNLDPSLDTTTVGVSSGCWNHSFALTGATVPETVVPGSVLGAPCTVTQAGFCVTDLQEFGRPPLGGILNQRIAPDFNVCFYARSKLLKCFTAAGTDLGTVPRGTTKAKVTLQTGVDGIWVLSAI